MKCVAIEGPKKLVVKDNSEKVGKPGYILIDVINTYLIPIYRMDTTFYEKLIDLCKDDPDVIDPLRFLREREVVHFQRFGEALRGIQDKLAQKKFYTATKSCMNSART